MGTYIIHFDDKPWEDLDDELYYRCFEIPWFSTTKTTISRLTPYTEDAAYAHGYTEAEAKYREIRDKLEKDAYQRGLNDAWECARTIFCTSHGELERIFDLEEDDNGLLWVYHEYTASEAIEKIRKYEQEKEEQDGLRQNIQTIVDQCGYTIDEIAEMVQKMKEANNG